jgi:ubiquinone/menaquinone biosynthesis C-methylase UbiE
MASNTDVSDRPNHAVQVPPSTYGRQYLSLIRTITHWHQANEVSLCCPSGGSVLEIGVGCGHTTWLMRQWGLQVTTVDLDPELRPDVVGDVTSLPFEKSAFDCVLAAEVLEHLPFEQFGLAVSELARVSRDWVIITLPAPLVGLSALLNVPVLPSFGFSLGLPLWKKHRFNGEHYWELGKRGYGKRRIRRAIREQGLTVVKEFRPLPSLYCYGFVTRRATGRV